MREVIGRSDIVGKPMAALLLLRLAHGASAQTVVDALDIPALDAETSLAFTFGVPSQFLPWASWSSTPVSNSCWVRGCQPFWL